MMHRIYSATSARWIHHRSGDPEQRFGRNQGIRVKENQDVVQGDRRPSIPHPGDVVVGLMNDSGTGDLHKLSRAIRTGVVHNKHLDGRMSDSLEVLFRNAEPIESLGNVASLVKITDTEGISTASAISPPTLVVRLITSRVLHLQPNGEHQLRRISERAGRAAADCPFRMPSNGPPRETPAAAATCVVRWNEIAAAMAPRPCAGLRLHPIVQPHEPYPCALAQPQMHRRSHELSTKAQTFEPRRYPQGEESSSAFGCGHAPVFAIHVMPGLFHLTTRQSPAKRANGNSRRTMWVGPLWQGHCLVSQRLPAQRVRTLAEALCPV